MASEQPISQAGQPGSIHKLFVEHPRSLGMTWKEHGIGAVKIGAELIGAGCAAGFPQIAGKLLDFVFVHVGSSFCYIILGIRERLGAGSSE